MALILNGSTNTIGGLAVGGLPDGTVDADTLADGAASGTKLTMPTNSIIQTQYNSTTTQVTLTSNSAYQEIGFTKAITPTASTSDILVLVVIHYDIYTTTGGEGGIGIKITRTVSGTETQLFESNYTSEIYNYSSSGTDQMRTTRSANILDTTISTTSAATYKVYARPHNTSSNGTKICSGSGLSSLTLMEVKG